MQGAGGKMMHDLLVSFSQGSCWVIARMMDLQVQAGG
jgi:hypothetical protein